MFNPWDPNRKLNLVQVQTTSVCNAKCICCPYKDSWYKDNPGQMTDELYLKLLNDIADYDPEFSGKFCPYLCNEPFADYKLAERIQLAYNILYDPYIEISTNCGITTKEKVDEVYDVLEKNDFYGKITISHHGIDKESFESFMEIPYEKTFDNMIYLLQKFDGKIKMSIQNMSESIDNKFRMNPHRAVIRYTNKFLKDNNINTSQLHTEPKVFHNRAGNVQINDWNYDKIVRKIDKDHPFDCMRLHGSLHVIYTGQVIGCCMDYYNETIQGDINNQTVKEFFNSSSYIKWTKQVKGELESPSNFICKRCQSPGG